MGEVNQHELRHSYQNRIRLEAFWARAKKLKTTDERLALLVVFVSERLESDPFGAPTNSQKRAHYRRRRMRGWAWRLGPCWVCRDRSQHRHHIIPLGQGGRNRKDNIVPLCAQDHRAVHAAR